MNHGRILGKDVFVSNDSRRTGLNNNDLIIGVSGSGKTGGYVIPNIMQQNGSMVVADTKGTLHRRFKKDLLRAGYKVRLLNFKDFAKSCSYNPLDYIRHWKGADSYREQDIITIAKVLVPPQDCRDPFWEMSARMVVACLIAFVKEALPEEEHNLRSVTRLYKVIGKNDLSEQIFAELKEDFPDSIAVNKYEFFKKTFDADRCWSSIQQFVSNALELFDMAEARDMFCRKSEFQIAELGRQKTALFVNISDTDRAFDRLINVFYTQLLHELCREADRQKDGRLKVPVRIILDDFATNVYIPDFDKIISVIRSREISVSVILQSISQLETMYTPAQAETIINGCDHLLYLGGQDVRTASFIGAKANKTTDSILNMGLDDAYLFTRGEPPRKIEKVPPYQYKRISRAPAEDKDRNMSDCKKQGKETSYERDG